MHIPIPFCEELHRVVMHPIPLHPDEIEAYREMLMFGEQHFPGAKDAELVIRTDAGGRFEGKTWQEHRKEGTALLGTGGGPFDEHDFEDQERTPGECSATKMATYLGVRDRQDLQRILNYILGNDTLAKHDSLLDFAEEVRCDFEYPMMNPKQVVWMRMCILNSYHRGQQKYWEAEQQLAQATITRVQTGQREYAVVTATVDNKEFGRFARTHVEVPHMVIILRNPKTGETFISPRKGFVEETHVDHIARIVRLAENKYRGRPSTLSVFELAKEGHTSETPEWYFVHGNLHNRVTPSAIPLDELTRLIAAVLSRKFGGA